MTSLFQLSELTRSLFSLWTFTLCLIGIFSIVRSVALKRFRFAAFALLPFGCSYFLWQVMFDLHLFGDTGAAAAVSRKLGALPWIGLLLALFVITPAAIVNLSAVIRYGKRSVTPDAVKLCLDWIPCGVCCFGDDGRVLFSNVCMNRLCIAATGSLLQNGNQFYDAVGDSILTSEGRRWRFVRREPRLDGERLHELTASDVTAEYAKTEAVHPMRTVTSTVRADGGERCVVAVKTVPEVPKERIFEVMAAIRSLTVSAPVRIGNVLLKDAAGTGSDIVAAANLNQR